MWHWSDNSLLLHADVVAQNDSGVGRKIVHGVEIGLQMRRAGLASSRPLEPFALSPLAKEPLSAKEQLVIVSTLVMT